MKYVIFTILFLFLLAFLFSITIVYRGYNHWVSIREDVIGRLRIFRKEISNNGNSPVYYSSDLQKQGVTRILDRNGVLLGQITPVKRYLIPLDNIPHDYIECILAVKDPHFYSERESSFPNIFILFLRNIRYFFDKGPANDILLRLSELLIVEDVSGLSGKVVGIYCSLEIQRIFDRDSILEIFLNAESFGVNLYGIRTASLYYFKSEVSNLEIFEAAYIISLMGNDSRLIYSNKVKRSHASIVNLLVKKGMVKRDYALKNFDIFWENITIRTNPPPHFNLYIEKNLAPYFNSYIIELLSRHGEINLERKGFTIYTTLDARMQLIARSVINMSIREQEKGTSSFVENNHVKPEGIILTIDPLSGWVLSMVGGIEEESWLERSKKNWPIKKKSLSENSKMNYTTFIQPIFNRVIHSKRQVGSAFKPFIFAAAIETLGYDRKTVILDAPIRVSMGGKMWTPSNYGNLYFGPVSLEDALKYSLNSVAVRLYMLTGSERILAIIGKALDLSEDKIRKRFKPYPSMALGVYSFSPMEIARCYAIFPRMGTKLESIALLRIIDDDGNVIVDNLKHALKRAIIGDFNDKSNVIKPETAEEINEMLKGVLKDGGTAYRAIHNEMLEIEAAGKTGTTSNFSDAWFIGYTDKLLTVVWVGYDNPSYSLGEGQTGGVVAAPIWAEYMKLIMDL